ncbi:transcriptional regulator [Moheibacter sediminis]|uniref:transcriptional regulator n=1 Tax=Moheibacter sediminis TaxID=1434700 RepID=UPI00117D841B|nr:hypothetical protein [Moheibacter sediminis]
MNSHPEEAFANTTDLIKQAHKLGFADQELELLKQRVIFYYYHDINFDKLISSAKELKEKAKAYNNPYMQTEANLYLFDAYCLNKFYDDALSELDEGHKTLDKTDDESDKLFLSRSKLYIAYANYYSTIGDTQKEIESLLASTKAQKKISNPDDRKESQIRDFGNLANAYSRIEKFDSAKYYAEASLNLMKNQNEINEKIKFINYLTLGGYYFHNQNYQEAVRCFNEAEKLASVGHFMNVASLYKKLSDSYSCMGNEQKQREYDYKLKDINIKVVENQNDSLHKIIERNKINDKSNIYILIIGGSAFIILTLSIVSIRYRNKNKLLKKQETASEDYLFQLPEVTDQSFKNLIDLVKKNDTAFMAEFQKTFPNFAYKLQSLNNSMVQSELEFCALLKLKLSTKEIAKYKNIMPRTVQNKKYRIRKRFEIPDNIDIYFWFEQL